MGYPINFLESRAVVSPGQFAIIPPEGRVINVIPGFEGFDFSILASPKLGAQAVFYLATLQKGAKTLQPFGKEGEERFLYYLDGKENLTVKVETKEIQLQQGGYLYAPSGKKIEIQNRSGSSLRILLYKQKYRAIDGHQAELVIGNVNDIQESNYGEMSNVFIKDLLPTHLGFDMNMHILSFEPAGCHPFVETHVQEHGAYILSGQGFYQIGANWHQVKAEDFLWFAPFTLQGTYATGRERFTYIYSKDCNRDEEL